MAVTVQQQPSGHHPVYNDSIYVVTSDKVSQDNFKYILDIYINFPSAIAHREAVPADPVYGSGVFNPSRIIENYVSGNFSYDTSGVAVCEDGAVVATLKFGEEFGLSSSGTTVYTNQVTVEIPYYNGVFDYEDFVSYNYALYRSENASSKFLTNSPAYKKVYTNENEYLYAINRTSGDIYYFEVTTYDSGLTPIGVYKIENTYQALTSDEHQMVRVAMGWNLNNIPLSQVTAAVGTFPIITSSVAGYYVRATNYAGSTTIGYKYYTLDTDCDRFTRHRIHFLNKLGGYDSYTFTKKNSFVSKIDRSNYKSNLGQLNSANSYIYSASQRAITQFNTVIEDTITCKSDWLSSGDLLWLEELVTSPDVYVERNGSAIPIVITNTSFNRQNGENERLFNLSIEFKYSYKRHRQRR